MKDPLGAILPAWIFNYHPRALQVSNRWRFLTKKTPFTSYHTFALFCVRLERWESVVWLKGLEVGFMSPACIVSAMT